ncbi:hypothetical protein PC129_g260 [Phytophthora cactorum]|uniref:Uncharacterized protein n=1 Tax=Phytophthora cactorum TaxID=29920 RepID=A0A329SIA7_9STRA|nr:hypothetical protein Pcac1_g8541 [Phytophthora cactorum]KAG2849250.1 hypothetical protein PC111_g63 [Phytophthora cactorum]KAG2869456.1 hypothetical protein PC113_g192 [Phytophthora cactorum]KAG2936614.1 hypothetical protein PC114_g68 [Phytophthora cactorum]KAG2944482.1 hypothetical protein PC115_g293 [Phytophthora cactorum]
MSDDDSDLDSAGFMLMPPPPPPPPPGSPPPYVNKPKYTGKARFIQSSVFASRDSGKPKARATKLRKKTENKLNPPRHTPFKGVNDHVFATNSDMDGLHARPAHMLSVVELCNNSEEDAESVATTAIDTPVHSADEDGNDTGDDGWADHNRWYCNICKDGGELLCCDRCPRAFHMTCLGMSDDMIPDSEWYCKMCSECLDRRRMKKESKEKARVMRETEKLERDARRRKAEQMREEMLAKKSVEAIEHKAKRVLEMQDRILSRKKIKYKDKEEEKLGRLAEDLGKTVRVSKEKLEKLEKEDAALRRKEESLNKKKRGIDEVPREVIEDTSRPDKPTPMPCDFADIPAKYVGKMLAVWDCIYAFRDILELSDITVDQFSRVLTHPMHSPMLTEIHMCLLEKILEDREDDDYVSDDEVSIDDSERYRYEIQHAPLTVGVPTRSMLTPLTWPSILCSLISAVPRYTAHATSTFLAAFRALQDTDYPALPVQHKLALLQFLAGRLVGTEKVRNILGKHLNEMIQGTKEYNRAVLQDKKLTLEDEKKLREKQRVELADIVESNKTSMKSWLGKGRDAVSADGMEETKSDFDGDSASDSDLDDLAYSEEALAKNEEELENLQVQEFISRHEYIARKKKLDKQRERLRQKMEVKQRKLQRQEQIERKRAQAKKGITDGLTSKDAALLRSAIEKGKECGLPDRIIVSATHVLEILDAEAVREEEALLKKRKFSALLLQSFVRSEAIGRDRDQLRYWILRGDLQRLYVERPGPADTLKRKYESLVKSGSPRDGLIPEDDDSNATWYCYSSQTEVTSLLEALDARVPREAQLRSALNDHMEKLSSEMPVSKPGLLISDLLNEESAKKRAPRASGSPADQEREFLQWKNNKHSKRKAVQHAEPSVESFREDLLKGQDWISKCLRTLGSTWPDRPENGGAEWRKSVQVIDKIEDFSASLLALETELMAAQTKLKPGSAAASNTSETDANKSANNASEEPEQNDEKSDEEDDDEEEEVMDALVDDGTMLWPSKYCRERWIQSVKRGKTVAVMATALASLVHRLEVLGFLNVSDEDAMKTRAQSEQEKRSRKERAVNKKKQVEEADDEDGRMVDEWEEDCYICSEGGELVCCDGCPHVFHYSCIGLRRIPRGKIFCHECDTSVNPVFPAKKNGKASSKRPRRSQSPPRGRRRKQAKLDKAKSDDSESESDADSDSAVSATSSARQASSKSSPVRPAHVENHTGPKNPEDQWDVDCSVCGLGGELLCCDGCPRAFHVNCIGLEKIPDTEWFCNECNLQTCGACKKNKIRLDSHVICGSEDGTKGCDRVFHLKCAKLDAVPADDWYCKKCRSKLNL